MPKVPSMPAGLDDFLATGNRRVEPKPKPEVEVVEPKVLTNEEKVRVRKAMAFLLDELRITKVSLALFCKTSERMVERMKLDSHLPVLKSLFDQMLEELQFSRDEFFALGDTSDPLHTATRTKVEGYIGQYGLRLHNGEHFRHFDR